MEDLSPFGKAAGQESEGLLQYANSGDGFAAGKGAGRMDATDRQLLELLQQDTTRPLAELGALVGLSATPCWKRIQRLEREGVIRARVALLDPARVGAGVTVFVSLRTGQHSREWLEQFAATVQRMPEVMEFYRMAGDVDYMLRVVVPDIAAYDAVYKRLTEIPGLTDVTSRFAMETIKYSTAVPVR
jgi:Lrp/AsnC family transcriptional regulator